MEKLILFEVIIVIYLITVIALSTGMVDTCSTFSTGSEEHDLRLRLQGLPSEHNPLSLFSRVFVSSGKFVAASTTFKITK